MLIMDERRNQRTRMQNTNPTTSLDSRHIRMNRVRMVEVESEILAELLAYRCLHGCKHIWENTEAGWVVFIIVATLEDTRADKACIPAIVIAADDIGCRIVTNHIRASLRWEDVLVVDLLVPASNNFIGVLEIISYDC